MSLLTETVWQGDLRSRRIEFEQLARSRHLAARLLLDDGTWLDVRNDGHHELLVLQLPEAFRQEVFTQLIAGQGGRDRVDMSTDEVLFRINLVRGGTHGHRVEIGSVLWVKCYYRGAFHCVFSLPHKVVEAPFRTLSGYVPHQR